MKTIIAGSRTITDYKEVHAACCSANFQITEVLCGGARGVDLLGAQWAEHQGIPVRMFPADWERLGRAAGPTRNEEMARNAEALVLVWDGKSRGSAHMRGAARRHGLLIHEVVIIKKGRGP